VILVCAATVLEMDACLASTGLAFAGLEFPDAGDSRHDMARSGAGASGNVPAADREWLRVRGEILFAVTGVGIPMTLARLLPLAASRRPELILNAGIAGAYPGSGLSIGDVVTGESEVFGDMGMEAPEQGGYLPLSSFPWADALYGKALPLVMEPFRGLRAARGCTVNTCTGTAETGRRREALTGAGFETMEGAAAALAGLELGIPVCELRAISNIASTRDFRPENARKALENLGASMGRWLERNA
jgi:futalosine hydrolase